MRAVNPGYVLFLAAAAGLLSLAFPWVFLPGPPLSVATIPAASVSGWQLGGIPILVISVGIAVCGYLFVRGQAGLVTKIVLVGVVLVYGMVAITETTKALGQLARSRGSFAPSLTDGSGPGIGMILCGVAVLALIVGAVLAIGWIPGYSKTPPVVWKQSHDS